MGGIGDGWTEEDNRSEAMEPQEQIFALVGVADEQQKAVQEALEGLRVERAALAREREAMAQALGAAVKQSLAGASEVAAGAFEEASKPFMRQLSGVVRAAGQAEGKLKGAVAAFGWRWAMLAWSAAAGGIVAVLAAAWLSIWWQRGQIERLSEQKAELQANAEDWAQRAGRAKLEMCGDKARLCVRVDKSMGYGKEGDYFVLRGY